MDTVIVDGEKAHSDAILRARMHEADCTHARHVATERVETEATFRETEQLLSQSLRDWLWCWTKQSRRRPHWSTCRRLAWTTRTIARCETPHSWVVYVVMDASHDQMDRVDRSRVVESCGSRGDSLSWNLSRGKQDETIRVDGINPQVRGQESVQKQVFQSAAK